MTGLLPSKCFHTPWTCYGGTTGQMGRNQVFSKGCEGEFYVSFFRYSFNLHQFDFSHNLHLCCKTQVKKKEKNYHCFCLTAVFINFILIKRFLGVSVCKNKVQSLTLFFFFHFHLLILNMLMFDTVEINDFVVLGSVYCSCI